MTILPLDNHWTQACGGGSAGWRLVPGGLLLLRSLWDPPPPPSVPFLCTLPPSPLLPSPHFGVGPGGGGGGVRVGPLPFHAYSRMKRPSSWAVTTLPAEWNSFNYGTPRALEHLSAPLAYRPSERCTGTVPPVDMASLALGRKGPTMTEECHSPIADSPVEGYFAPANLGSGCRF